MRNQTPILACIGLGSNLSDRRSAIEKAVAALRATDGIEVAAVSRIVETRPVGGPAGSPDFLNAAATLLTTLPAHRLLHELLAIETSMGRTRRVKWEPRIIDLDLLLYGQSIVSSQELVVPHPLMHERRFVLEPLAQIAPDVVHPVLQMTIAGLLANLDR